MSKQYSHVGLFSVNTEDKGTFVQVMKDYEENVKKAGLENSRLVELDNKLYNFRFITIWESRTAWEAVEKLDVHKAMQLARDLLLLEPAKEMSGSVSIVM